MNSLRSGLGYWLVVITQPAGGYPAELHDALRRRGQTCYMYRTLEQAERGGGERHGRKE